MLTLDDAITNVAQEPLYAYGAACRRRCDVADIWQTLQELRDIRNNIHLFKAAQDPQANFDAILEKESQLLPAAQYAIQHLSKIEP